MISKLESWRRAAYNAAESLAGCLARPEIAKHLDQAAARTVLEELVQARIEMLAASEAAQPAAGEPVAWMYDTPRNGRQYHDKRLDHYWWDDFKGSYVKGVPLYAAAHGNSEFFVDFDTLRKALSMYGLAAPVSNEELGLQMERQAIRVIEAVAKMPFPTSAAAHGDEALKFEYVGPKNERKTVEVTREEVADHLDYMLFEKLTAAVCMCDPSESDDCRCDEYAEQFAMRAQGDGDQA